ncbi:MAG: hypothetical protein ACYC5Y_02345 [Symbiobacteriia bacterium]
MGISNPFMAPEPRDAASFRQLFWQGQEMLEGAAKVGECRPEWGR